MPGLNRSPESKMENIETASSDDCNVSSSPLKKGFSESKRKSGRSAGKPNYYGSSPIVYSPAAPSPKRLKKSLLSNSSENESDSSNDTSSDFNNKVQVSFRKPQSVVKQSSKTTKRTPKRGSAKKANSSTVSLVASRETLFDIVKGGKSALQAVLDDWIDSYNDNRVSAVVDLIQYFIQCCGCKGEVTPEMIESDDTVVAIRQLTEKFEEDSHEYPMIMSGPSSRKFKSNFCHFIELMIEGCQHTIIYDDFFMDTLISWFIGLADSQVRAFRHTITIAALKLVTSLIGIVVNVETEQETTTKQLESEAKKPSAKRSRERMEILKSKLEELEQKIAEIQDIMSRVFAGIFVHRYRDVRPEIRSTCIAELGTWMISYNSYFLHQNYLKYTGWTLHDKVGDVRLKALQSLEALYQEEEFIPELELFTNRFKERMIGMTKDKDADVAVHGIRLAGALARHDILEEEDCVEIEKLVFCKNTPIAREAGQFLMMRLTARAVQLSPNKGRKGARETLKKCSFIKLLIEFFIKSGIHQQAAYLVDSLFDHCPLIKDWKLMTDILLDAYPVIDLNDEEENVLIDMIAASCAHSATGNPPTGRVIKKAARERRQLAEDKHSLSTHFVSILPDFMRKFGADVKKLTAIVSICNHLDLDVYGEKGIKNKLQELLDLIDETFQKHSDKELLDICSQVLNYLNDDDFPFKHDVEVSISSIIDTVFGKFDQAISNGIPTEADKDDHFFFDLDVNLKRLTSLSRCHDLEDWEIKGHLMKIMKQAKTSSVENEILINALTCYHLMIIWNLTTLDTDQPNKSILRSIKTRVEKFVAQLDELIQFSNAAVQEQAYLILSDVLVIFANQLKNTSPVLAGLVFEADTAIQLRARDFVMSFVFSSEEQDDDETSESDDHCSDIHRKRVVLGAFCKLVSFNIFDVRLAAPIFGQLIKSATNYSDIIKFTMNKAREVNPISFTKTLMLSLQQAYANVITDSSNGHVVWSSSDLIPLKDLCRKFALTYGVDTKREMARQCVITFHREGILYALEHEDIDENGESHVEVNTAPHNLSFLEIVNEFTYRLIPQDRVGKNGIIAFLDDKAKAFANKKGSDWAPYLTYRNGITGEASTSDDHHSLKGRSKGASKKATAPGRKKRKMTTGSTPRGNATPHAADSDNDIASASDDDDTLVSPLGTSRLNQTLENDDSGDDFQTSTARKNNHSKAKKVSNIIQSPLSNGDDDDDDSDSDGDPLIDSLPLSSQRSWLSSQKKMAKPKVSYSSNKKQPHRKRQREDNDSDASDSDDDVPLMTSLSKNKRVSISKRFKSTPQNLADSDSSL